MKKKDTLGSILHSFTVPQSEATMPYYISNDNELLYSSNEVTGTPADIFMLSLTTNKTQSFVALFGVEEYYPIGIDDTSFLFTR